MGKGKGLSLRSQGDDPKGILGFPKKINPDFPEFPSPPPTPKTTLFFFLIYIDL